jgi:hypothetical protein
MINPVNNTQSLDDQIKALEQNALVLATQVKSAANPEARLAIETQLDNALSEIHELVQMDCDANPQNASAITAQEVSFDQQLSQEFGSN